MRLQYALATRSLNLPVRAAIKQAARQAGITGVRLDLRHELPARELSQTGKRELRHLLKELGLQLAAVNFSTRNAFNDLNGLDRRLAATREAIDLAAMLEVRHLCLRIGKIPSPEEGAPYELMRETISDLARQGNRVGVILTLIPGSESAETIEHFLRDISTGPLAIDFDPSRVLPAGHDPSRQLRALHQFVAQFTARDAVRDFSGGSEQTQLGRGEVVWDEVLATLAEIDFNGWITLQPPPGDQPAEQISQSLTYLQNVVNEF